MKTRFQEVQKFTQWWLWLILLAAAAIPAVLVLLQAAGIAETLDAPADYVGLGIYGAIMIILLVLFGLMKLRTEIDDKEIRVHFPPFVKRVTRWDEVEKAEVVDYGFVGGWGIRIWTRFGTVYNVKGRKGLALSLKNGKKFLVGTQKEAELQLLMRKLRGKNG